MNAAELAAFMNGAFTVLFTEFVLLVIAVWRRMNK